MDDLTRLGSDVMQLTRRLDDFSMRLAIVETQYKLSEEKLSSIKKSIDRWNTIGFWLITLVAGKIILDYLSFVQGGGLKLPL